MLVLVAAGTSYKRAAKTLGISVNTVNEHLKRAYRKLGVASCREAVSAFRVT